MNTLHLKISIFIGLFLALWSSGYAQQEEVDYASRFYEIKYSSDTIKSCPRIDSIQVLDIYGTVFYRGENEDVQLVEGNTKLVIGKRNDWVTYDIEGEAVDEYKLIYSQDSLLQGLTDKLGNIIIPIEYEQIVSKSDFYEKNKSTFYHKLNKGRYRGSDNYTFENYVVKKNGKYGIINKNNQLLTPFVYDDISLFENNYGETFFTLKRNEKYYFASVKTGKLLTKDFFSDWRWEFHRRNGHVIPVQDANTGLWGCMDYVGKMIIPCKYKDVRVETWNNNWNWRGYIFQLQKDNDLWDIIDLKGRKLYSDCEKVFCDIDTSCHTIFVSKDRTMYALNVNTGEKKYSFENYQIVYSELNYAVVEYNNMKGCLDILSGKIIIPCQYDYIHLNRDYQNKVKYAACMKYEDNTVLDYIRLKDGEITHSYNNYRGNYPGCTGIISREGKSYSWSWYSINSNDDESENRNAKVNIFDTKSGFVCVVSITGENILDERYKIQKYIVFNDYIITNAGIFDITGHLVFEGDYNVVCWYNEIPCVLFNNKNQEIEYYAYVGREFHKVDSYDAIYRYYYTQCQEKFRKQPSDVDKNIPETNTTNSNTYAFIIANEDYPSAPVPFGLNDGRSFKTYCEKTLGIPANHVYLYENATNGQLIACVEQIKKAAKAHEGDIDILFYYAGHAFPDAETKTACLLPIDGDVTIPATGYSLDKLYGELGQLNVNSVVCFIDACFSGATREDNSLLAGRAVIVQPKNSEPRGNTVVFTAADSTETAHQYQAKKHGMFTYYLLKKLQESKGEVTLGELADYLNSNVKKMSFEVNNKLQTPKVLVSPAMELKWRTLKLND